jgi:hypothetical protein
MSVKASANRFALDALTNLRAAGQAALTATAKSTANASDVGYLTLDQLSSYWAMGDNANLLSFALNCTVESVTQVSGTPTIQFSVIVDTDPAFTSPSAITVVTGEAMTATGSNVLEVNREDILEAIVALGGPFTTATPVYLAVTATIAGGASSPQIAWNAYAAPLAGV